MTRYKVAEGHDALLVNMDDLVPQPTGGSGIIRYTRRDISAAGTVHGQGLYVPLTWQNLAFGTAAFTALLAQFGLDDATSNDVTVLVRDEVLGDVRMNGRAIRPMAGESMEWTGYRPRDVVIVVRDLEAAS